MSSGQSLRATKNDCTVWCLPGCRRWVRCFNAELGHTCRYEHMQFRARRSLGECLSMEIIVVTSDVTSWSYTSLTPPKGTCVMLSRSQFSLLLTLLKHVTSKNSLLICNRHVTHKERSVNVFFYCHTLLNILSYTVRLKCCRETNTVAAFKT